MEVRLNGAHVRISWNEYTYAIFLDVALFEMWLDTIILVIATDALPRNDVLLQFLSHYMAIFLRLFFFFKDETMRHDFHESTGARITYL